MAVYEPNELDKCIVSSRIRLARNLSDYPFRTENKEVANSIIKQINRAVVKADTFNLYYLKNLSNTKLLSMQEKYLISKNLIENKEFSAVLINKDESVSIMINEEDVIREQCFMRGLRLTEALKKLDKVDEELFKNLPIAFDKEFGFLTACPTNLGTGLRASVMLFLPALTESRKIVPIIKKIEDLGLTVRGVYGEGSRAEGFMYQISNEVTLGLSEFTIVDEVESAVISICEAEIMTQKSFYGERILETKDRVKRAYGLLTNCAVLSYSEFLDLIASVKLGVSLDLLKFEHPEAIDDLIVSVRPGNLCEKWEADLSPLERDIFRAEFVGGQLNKIKGNF